MEAKLSAHYNMLMYNTPGKIDGYSLSSLSIIMTSMERRKR
jgi:hypothetical protein